jgi:hypothetical protein
MVKKKVIGIVVVYTLLMGNGVASTSVDEEKTKDILKIVEESIGGIVESILERRLSGISQKIDAIQQLSQDSKKRERSTGEVIFKSAQDVRKYTGSKNGRIDERDLSACINRTMDYFQGDACILRKGLPLEWRDAKIVEILSEIVEIRDPNLMDLVMGCYDMIREKCGNSKFTRARLLLMSQCTVWNEEKERFELQVDRDKEVIRKAMRLLYSVSQQEDRGNSEAENARQLLESLKSDKEIVLYFPEEYFEKN